MVLRAKEVSPTQLNYSSVKKSKSGKYSLVTYNDQPLRIQLSKSECKYIKKDNRHFINITLGSNDSKFFRSMDSLIEESYIDDDDPLDYSRQLINGSINVRLTTDTDDHFTAKLYEPGSNPQVIDYTSGNLNLLFENRIVSVIIECIGIWFKKGRIGVTWKVNQMQLSQNKIQSRYSIIDSDEDEDEDDEPDLFPEDNEL